MPEPETPAEPRTPWYRKVAMVIGWFLLWPTVPFALVILLALGLYAVIHIIDLLTLSYQQQTLLNLPNSIAKMRPSIACLREVDLDFRESTSHWPPRVSVGVRPKRLLGEVGRE